MPVINVPIIAYSGHDSFNVEFTTDEPATSSLSYSYTDKFGILRTGSTAHSIPDTVHNYAFTNIPRDTVVTYDLTAVFPNGGPTVNNGPNTITTRSPKLFANIRTADVVVGGSEISLREAEPKLYENPRLFYVQMTVSANTSIRFEENQDLQTLIPNQVYYFYAVGDIYLTGPSTVSLAFMKNPNY